MYIKFVPESHVTGALYLSTRVLMFSSFLHTLAFPLEFKKENRIRGSQKQDSHRAKKKK